MHISTIFIILSLSLFYYTMGVESLRCNTGCTREYNPICGYLKRPDGKKIQCTFSNPCELGVHRCLTKQKWKAVGGRCSKNSAECGKIMRRN